ncbi:uncharacterized protein LOC144622253 [Crassostrea virginica]
MMSIEIIALLLVCSTLSATVEAKRKAKGECNCTLQDFEPVCGKNGVTYSNSCFLRCARVRQACEGECPCELKRLHQNE